MSRIQLIILLIVLLIVFQLVFSSKEHFRNDPPYFIKPKINKPKINKPKTPQNPPSQLNYTEYGGPLDPSRLNLSNDYIINSSYPPPSCYINVDNPNKCPKECWDFGAANPDTGAGPCPFPFYGGLYNCASC